MSTEEILRREAEYRVVREALGTYLVDVVAGQPPARLLSPAGAPSNAGEPSGSPLPTQGAQPHFAAPPGTALQAA
jgi:hypothetical protein